MNNQEKYKEDPLRQYFNPGMIENPPDGFTYKVMTRIQSEPEKGRVKKNRLTRNIIPVTSTFVTALLIIAALIIPAGKSNTGLLTLLNPFRDFRFPELKLNFDFLFNFSLPDWLPYIFVSILFLSILDKALFGFFHRDNSRNSANQES